VTGLYKHRYFGSFVLSPVGGSDVFIAKYNATGNVIWASSAAGSANEWKIR